MQKDELEPTHKAKVTVTAEQIEKPWEKIKN